MFTLVSSSLSSSLDDRSTSFTSSVRSLQDRFHKGDVPKSVVALYSSTNAVRRTTTDP